MNLTDYLRKNRAIDLARDLNIPSVLISQWSRGIRRVPAERCIQIEQVTHGVVRCETLRPDIDWSVLRCPAPREAA